MEVHILVIDPGASDGTNFNGCTLVGSGIDIYCGYNDLEVYQTRSSKEAVCAYGGGI